MEHTPTPWRTDSGMVETMTGIPIAWMFPSAAVTCGEIARAALAKVKP